MRFTQSVKFNKNWNLKKKIGNDLWEVRTPFVWLIDYEKKLWDKIIIKEWFQTNFGSIPRIFWSIFDKNKYVAYILHDWLVWERFNQLINESYKIFESLIQETDFYKKIKLEKELRDNRIKRQTLFHSIDTGWIDYNRFQADWILFKALKVEWASIIERVCIYWAVSFWSLLVYFRKFLYVFF